MQFFLSTPANPQLAGLARSLSRKGREVKLLPLEALPPAQPERLGPLRVEHAELLSSLAFVNWCLALLRNGTWQPDVVLETDLKLDAATLQARLDVVKAKLDGEEGGADGG